MVGPRAYFVTMTKPATLSLEAVQLDDEGIYRCRVDFKNSPTKNFQVNLTVIGRDSITLKKKIFSIEIFKRLLIILSNYFQFHPINF